MESVVALPTSMMVSHLIYSAYAQRDAVSTEVLRLITVAS
jgi:hypothetical protein